MQLNKPQLERMDVTCPFCLESTGRWKLFQVVWRKREIIRGPMRGRFVVEPWEVNNAKDITQFEHDVLQSHIPNCTVIGACGNPTKVLSLYSL
jgi:hypothetical protein